MLGVFLCQGGFIMQLRQIITDVGGTFKSIELPNSRSVVMLGDDKVKDSVMGLVKSMLGCDYIGVLSENFDIDTFTSSSSLIFDSGELFLRDKAVATKGKVPRLHYIEYTGGDSIESFLVTMSTDDTNLGVDLTKYSNIISQDKWLRLIALTNSVVGFEFVSLHNDNLVFSFDTSYMSESALKVTYLLVAESFVTPSGYTRLVCIRDKGDFSNKELGKLIEVLDNIRNLERVICTVNLVKEDFSSNSKVSFVDI